MVWEPGSGENMFRIPDPRIKIQKGTRSGSATLCTRWCYCAGGSRGEEHVPGWGGLLHPPPAATRQPGRAQEHGELPQGLHSAREGNSYYLFLFITGTVPYLAQLNFSSIFVKRCCCCFKNTSRIHPHFGFPLFLFGYLFWFPVIRVQIWYPGGYKEMSSILRPRICAQMRGEGESRGLSQWV